MIKRCDIWDPWSDHNWTPCFREKYLNTALILCVVGFSLITSLYRIVQYTRRNKDSSLYEPINKPSRSNYGSITTDQDDASSSNTIVTPEPKPRSWSAYDWIRCVLSVLQLYLVLKITTFTRNDDDIEQPIEGSYQDLLIMYYSRIILWSYCTIYALLNICLSFSTSGKYICDVFCSHLNYLYVFDFVVQLINLSAYYIVHDIDEISPRYQNWIISSLVTLSLIITFINEARYEPAEPIIADTGRVMSGETWASLYSKFMFSWVDPMLKMGNQKTLNPDDLFELIPKNRTKSTLNVYRIHKRAKMAYSLLLTFRKPLFIQFLYCMGWCVFMFGPPYFLNRIIKFIEHADQQETLSSAYISVFMLFVTSCTNSLCYQQALYIGRSLGIQIQSIVIGEVYNKSLKRRDKCDTAELNDKAKKANVNNLLSVDAQKLAEIVSYVFYVYCFPVQVSICIWSLYKLLGNASLWGVLIIFLSQPITYYLSRNFQRLQHQVLECTDRRITLMNELLSAIRIVKFFAWENQFKTRVMNARDAELKAVRARLMSYMWIGNVWFFIPAIIMVATFYAYTLDHKLTASTAFTALALFNNFKTALDELPVVISFLLQAGVSLDRVEKFLKEEEVDAPPTTTTTGQIGFTENASFSWQEQGTPQLKDLNLDFPVNQMSIVCGPTGSGKTTLIMSLLGETYCLSGQALLPRKKPTCQGGAVSGIAYVAQTAWLQNCSIRENILYGLPFDKERYEKILYMTALTRDLEILEFGDATEVGEKGITLSGGQKQRVAIARAVYSQADIVILDDCLSAVDAHTAKHLYEHCLVGEYMRNRTVILVTHHVGLCIRGAGYVVALDESGSVAASGKPLDVIRTGVLGDEITEQTWKDAKEEAAVDGPIPVVPQTIKAKASLAEGMGKLVQEEKREEGGVKWSVYGTYYYASGGFIFWASVIVLFGCAQASVVGQDYWIRVWSAAYDNVKDTVMHVFNMSRGEVALPMNALKQVVPESLVQQFSERLSDEHGVNVGYYLGIYFLIGMLTLVLATVRSLVLFMGSLRASRRIHAQLLDRILRAKVRFFDTTPIGRIVNRFSSDLETIDQALAPSLAYLLYTGIAAIYVILLISAITPSFIIPGFVVALLFKYIGAYYLNTSRDMKRLNSVSRSPIYVHFNETVVGVSTIRAFGSQTRFINVNHTHIDNNNRPFLWMWATNRWLHCRIDCLGAFVGFLTGAVLLASRDWINAGLAGLSLSYALTFTHHILFVVRMYAINEMNMNAIERVHEYLVIEEEPPAHIPETSPRISWPEMGKLSVENLVMQYAPDTPAVLCNVSFETKPREKIGIVGRTGSGKSTLAMSLFRFMEPTSGRILIDGIDIHTIGLDDLRSRLTIIPQDPVLFSGTLRSNLDPFDQYDDATLWAALKRAHLIDAAENAITLDSPVNENGSNWSQGQRQLIALARALVKKSPLIVLDEATSSVDFDTDHQIQETIRKEFNDSTLLCIAHRIRTVVDYDRILVLDHGEIKEFDTPYNLMTREDSIFQQMCKRSGEFNELLAIAKQTFNGSQHL